MATDYRYETSDNKLKNKKNTVQFIHFPSSISYPTSLILKNLVSCVLCLVSHKMAIFSIALKTFLAILLMLTFLLPFVGRYASIEYQAYKTKKEVKHKLLAGIDCKELVSLTISKQDAADKLNWHHHKEFEYQGQMYDIVYADSIGNDTIQYWLYWDNDETKLNRQLASLVANVLGHDPIQQERNAQFNNFTKDIFCIEIVTLQMPLPSSSVLRYSLAGASLNPPAVPVAPPPEIMST
jgi:hypothetical protein